MSTNPEYKYDTFNARYLSLEEVASTFISNQIFDQLITNNHTLLMGPRGCGKTTLLKMLTPRAIHQFNQNKKTEDTLTIPFIGIYIPSDKQWEKQLKNFEKKFIENENFYKIISKQIVNTNIIISLLNTFHDLTFLHFSESQDILNKEREISIYIIEQLDLKKPIPPTYISIIIALKDRVKEINSLINQVEWGFKKIEQIAFPDYFFFDFLNIIDPLCLKFELIFRDEIMNNKLSSRWALCFDELEIAPNWLQQTLIINHLRSTNQKFIFKLTTTPLVDSKIWPEDMEVSQRPSQNEDYKVIRNWVFDSKSDTEWKLFSKNLLTSLIERNFSVTPDLLKLFGGTTSNMNKAIQSEHTIGTKEIQRKAYFEGSVEYEVFRSLAQSDKSFYTFLDRKKIMPINPIPPNLEIVDSVFRKVKPIAYHRYYFRKKSGLRSRKTIDLYSGVPLLYDLCDGNPRTLLNIFDGIKPLIKINKQDNIHQILIPEQARTIQELSAQKLENIKNHPDVNVQLKDGTRLNLGNLLEEIGESFFRKLVEEDFNMDPIGSFVIDENVNPQIVDLLRKGLNLGAIQYINAKQDIANEDVYNKQYRLSFILYPVFKLPIREYKSIHLSRMLPKYAKNSHLSIKNRRTGRSSNDENQQELF